MPGRQPGAAEPDRVGPPTGARGGAAGERVLVLVAPRLTEVAVVREGVWLNELNYLAPRAYVYTPYWGETADPALRRVLETVILDPEANVAELLATAAKDAQSAQEDLK
jgi:hypothetical protein